MVVARASGEQHDFNLQSSLVEFGRNFGISTSQQSNNFQALTQNIQHVS